MLSFSWCRSAFLSVRKKVGKPVAFAAALPTFFCSPLSIRDPLYSQALQGLWAGQLCQLVI